MSIHGIGGGAGGLGPRLEPALGRPGERAAVDRRPDVAPREGAALGLESASLPAEAPPGTDPELWSVLTTEERAYYARIQALGPLTYHPARASGEVVGRGGRIDLRV